MKDAFDNSEEEEEATEAIFKKLRPHSQYKFKQVLEEAEKNPAKVNRMMGPMGVIVRD